MIIHVANPIYDSVFKYLMEDERIARTMKCRYAVTSTPMAFGTTSPCSASTSGRVSARPTGRCA